MKLDKFKYEELNSRQKENVNYHRIAYELSKYGYNSMRLNDDYQGADFIALHTSGEIIRVQLKSRFTLSKKYIGKDLYIAFIEGDDAKIFEHDKALPLLRESTLKTESWAIRGGHSWKQTPRYFESVITIL